MILDLQEKPPIWGQSTDRRQMLMSQWHPQDRRVAPRRPGAHGHGQQIEARLIYPDDRALLVVCFFLSAGQRSRHQAAIASSLR